MSVQSKKEKDKLIIELDNGELREFEKVMDKWHFRDYQSLMRFAISLLVLNENKSFPIRIDNESTDIMPAAHLIKG